MVFSNVVFCAQIYDIAVLHDDIVYFKFAMTLSKKKTVSSTKGTGLKLKDRT